jgi:hypothetical protein
MNGPSSGAPAMSWQPLLAGGAVGAVGEVLRLDEPLSLWGGLDPASGEIVDQRHPQCGLCVTGRVLVMAAGRGSSSASSVLLEAVRLGTAPTAILLLRSDGILALGGAVAREIYGRTPPIGLVRAAELERLTTGRRVELHADGRILELD